MKMYHSNALAATSVLYMLKKYRQETNALIVLVRMHRTKFILLGKFRMIFFSAQKPLPYEKCDIIHNLTYTGMAALELPGGDTPGTACRWTVVSPPNCRILISCPNNSKSSVIERNKLNKHYLFHFFFFICRNNAKAISKYLKLVPRHGTAVQIISITTLPIIIRF